MEAARNAAAAAEAAGEQPAGEAATGAESAPRSAGGLEAVRARMESANTPSAVLDAEAFLGRRPGSTKEMGVYQQALTEAGFGTRNANSDFFRSVKSPGGEYRRVQEGPFNFVAYNDGTVRVSSGGNFQPLTPALMEAAKAALKLPLNFERRGQALGRSGPAGELETLAATSPDTARSGPGPAPESGFAAGMAETPNLSTPAIPRPAGKPVREVVTEFSRPEEAQAFLPQFERQFPDSKPVIEQRGKKWVLTMEAGYQPTAETAEAVGAGQTQAANGKARATSEPTGSEGTAYTASNRPVPFRYAVVEGENLVPSHTDTMALNPAYDQALQPRDRTRIASEAQVSDIATTLNPARLGESASTAEGAPIVGVDGQVESGNGRTLAILRAYRRNLPGAQAYREWLGRSAPAFGLDPAAVQGMKRPVLVRVRQGEVTPQTRGALADEMGRTGVSGMSEPEIARTDAQRLAEKGLLSLYVPNEDANVASLANTEFTRRFLASLPSAERNSMLQADGMLSASGVRRIRNALLGAAYEDPALLSRLTEDTDPNIRTVGAALLNVAPKMAVLKQEIGRGNRFPGLDITQDLAAAANVLSRLRDQGTKVETYLDQLGMFGEELTPVGKDLLRVMENHKRSGKRLTAVLDYYAEAADALGDPRQQALFEGEAPNALSVLEAARQVAEKTTHETTQPLLFGGENQPTPRADNQGTFGAAPGRAPDAGTSAHASAVPQPDSSSKPPLADLLRDSDSLGAFGGKAASDLAEATLRPVFERVGEAIRRTPGALRDLHSFGAAVRRAYAGATYSHIRVLWKLVRAAKQREAVKPFSVDASATPEIAARADAARNLFVESASYLHRVAPGSLDALVRLDKASDWVKNYFTAHVSAPLFEKLSAEDRIRFGAYGLADRLLMEREVLKATEELLPKDAGTKAQTDLAREHLAEEMADLNRRLAGFVDPTTGASLQETDVRGFFARSDIRRVTSAYADQIQPKMESMRARAGRTDIAPNGLYSDIFVPGIAVNEKGTPRTGAGGKAPLTKPQFALGKTPGVGKFKGTADAYLYDIGDILQTRMRGLVRSAFQREFWQQLLKDGQARPAHDVQPGDSVRVHGKNWGDVTVVDASDPLQVTVATPTGKQVSVDRTKIQSEEFDGTMEITEGGHTRLVEGRLLSLTDTLFGRGGIPEEELRALGLPRQVVVADPAYRDVQNAFHRMQEPEFSMLGAQLINTYLAGPAEGIAHGTNLSGRLAAILPVETGIPPLDAALELARPAKSLLSWKHMVRSYPEALRAEAQRLAAEYGVSRDFQQTWGWLGAKAGGRILYGQKGLFNNALNAVTFYGKRNGWTESDIGHVMRELNTHSRVLQPEMQKFLQSKLGMGAFYNTGKTTVNVGMRYGTIPTVVATSLIFQAALHRLLDKKHRWPWQIPGRRIGEIPFRTLEDGREVLVDISGLDRPGRRASAILNTIIADHSAGKDAWETGWDVASDGANLALDPMFSGPLGGVLSEVRGRSLHQVPSRDDYAMTDLPTATSRLPLNSPERLHAILGAAMPWSSYALGDASEEFRASAPPEELRGVDRMLRLLGPQIRTRDSEVIPELLERERMRKQRSEELLRSRAGGRP